TIGYVLGRDYWGKGYMTQALIAVSRFFLQEADINRLSATHDTANPGSGRVMQKAGFHFEGILRQAGHNNQGIVDSAHYSLLKSDL
ncbi:GNAT family protein, partial [Abiotrophia sp.]